MNQDHYNKAINLEAAGDLEGSVAELRELIESADDPSSNGPAFVAIADNLTKLGRYDDARAFITRAYASLDKNDTHYPYVMYIAGCIEQEAGNLKSALAILDSLLEQYAIPLQSTDHEDLKFKVYGVKGAVLVELNRSSEARHFLELAVANSVRGKDNAFFPLYYLGICCFELGDAAVAERRLKELLTLEAPLFFTARAHYYLAVIYMQRQQFAWGRQEFEWCLTHGAPQLSEKQIVKGLFFCSERLGLKKDAERYSEMLRKL